MPKFTHRGKEITRTVHGLWTLSFKHQIKEGAEKCTMDQLIQKDEVIVENILSNIRQSRRIELMRQQRQIILEIARETLNDKIGNINQSLQLEEAQIRDDASIRSTSTAQSARIPALDSSEPSSQSSLGSLPSRPRSLSSESEGNPFEAMELFCYEPQQ